MKPKESAGLAIIYEGKILLIHPTGSKWFGSYGIPKGGIEDGESALDAAIREVREEIGVSVPMNLIDKNMRSFKFKSSSYTKIVYYFIVRISDLSQIGLSELRVPKSQLQMDEVDWAGFITYEDAKKRVTKSQRDLIDNLTKLGLLESTLINNKKIIKMTNIKNFDSFVNETKNNSTIGYNQISSRNMDFIVFSHKGLEDLEKKYNARLIHLMGPEMEYPAIVNLENKPYIRNITITELDKLKKGTLYESVVNESKSDKKVLSDLRADLEKMINKYESKLADTELDQLSDFIVVINNKIKEK